MSLTPASRIAAAINKAQHDEKLRHLRVGQLIFNAVYDFAKREIDVFFVSDDALADALERYNP